jgi:5-methylcytosine-specific restriction endonuclease McrA
MLTYWIGKPITGSGLGTPKAQIELPNGHVEYEIDFGRPQCKGASTVFYEVDPVLGHIVKARNNGKEYGREYADETW